MVQRINLLRNVGQFDDVSAGAQLLLDKLTLVYAENGRGKTTLSTILRSLSTGEAKLISDRHRLGAVHLPHIVMQIGATSYVFQNGAWSASWPHVAVFDDNFVAENVCSGIDIGSEHRQNLHGLILGAQGVNLYRTLQNHVEQIEQHNRNIKEYGNDIPVSVRGGMSLDEFCALDENANIAQLIQDTERNIAAAQSADKVRRTSSFAAIQLPRFDIGSINQLLQRNLSDLDSNAAAHVQEHLTKLGQRGEAWASEGIPMISAASVGTDHEACPFCLQDLQNSTIIQHYRSYFSTAYSTLKQDITTQISVINTAHGEDALGTFERSIGTAIQQQQFWHTLVDVAEINIDTAAYSQSWKTARNAVLEALLAKQASPLEPTELSTQAITAINDYHANCDTISTISDALIAANPQIDLVKERTATASITTLQSDLIRLKATAVRHSPTITLQCQRYLDEKATKVTTEALRDTARAALDQYRQTVFPAYEAAINTYLQRLNAGFRIGSVVSTNTRAGASCTYNVIINNTPVAATANDGATFSNTLSAGDRNTLALAFFFAALDQDPQLAQKTVVIDDPMTSLDDHRTLATVQEMRRLINRVNQLIVLSHSKPFLCQLWEAADRIARSAMTVSRSGGTSSTLSTWDVTRDCITEHDRRHELIAEYMQNSDPAKMREVASALRPTLEYFIRAAYPTEFAPGSMIGRDFLPKCRTRLSTPTPLLTQTDIDELQDLLDYGNLFHHDTNPAYRTTSINDQELVQFCTRVLRFTRRP